MNKTDINAAQDSLGSLPNLFGLGPDAADELTRNYTVKYFKANIDEPSDALALQALETKSMAGDEVILTDRQTNFYEGTFFVVLRYLEKRP